MMFPTWALFGFGATICFAGMILTFKKILTLGSHPLVLNAFVFTFAAAGFLSWVVIEKIEINMTGAGLLFVLLAVVFALLGNYFDVMALVLAPNPGYATTIKSGQIVFVTLLAPLLYHSSLNATKIGGIIIVIIGIFLVSID